MKGSDTGIALGQRALLCRVGRLVCALPLEIVSEIMRPLPLDPLGGMPEFLAGISIIRGGPVPVVDLAKLLGAVHTAHGRLVLLNVQDRSVALAVDDVIGVRMLEPGSTNELPPLLHGANAELVRAIGSLDARLLIVLEGARILPESIWAELRASGAGA